MKDWQLLQQWVEHRSETAFTQLVDRHIDFVHNCARRQVGDPALAQDVTQAVFLLLSRKAASFRENVILTSWLFRTTRFIAARAQRAEYRRLRLETASAATMQSHLDTPHSSEPTIRWADLEPHLDTVIARLPGADRDALLLRFFERKPFKEVATQLGVSEDAAKKRVTRAVERIREGLARQGVSLSGVALGTLLSELHLEAAPQELATAVSQVATGTASPAPALDALVDGASRDWLWQGSLQRIPMAIGAVALIAGAVVFWPQSLPQSASSESFATGAAAASAPLSPGASDTQSSVSFAKLNTSTLRLRVVDSVTGTALEGARVRITAWGPAGMLPEEQRRTDPEGALQIGVAPHSFETIGITVALEGYVPTLAEWSAHEFVAPVLKHTYRLNRGAVVRGDVRDASGNPVSNARVSLAGFWSFEPSLRENLGFHDTFTAVLTDANGHFETGQVPNPLPPSGGFILSVTHPEFVRGTIDVQNMDQLATNQTITLRPGIFYSGRVLDEQGHPVEGANVEENHHHIGSRRSTRADAAGAFVIGPFSPGPVPIEVSGNGYRSVEKEIVLNNNPSPGEWILQPAALTPSQATGTTTLSMRVTGTAVDADTGSPLTEFKVTAAQYPERDLWRLMGTGRDGNFGWNVRLGSQSPMVFRVEAEGYATQDSPPMTPEEAVAPLVFHLHRVPGIRGRILQPDGEPAAGAGVSLNGDGYGFSFELPARFVNYGPAAPHSIADAEGVFELRSAANPRMVLFVHPTGCLALPVENVTNVLVRLESWGSLEGTLQIGGKLAPNEKVQAIRRMPDPMHPPMGVHLIENTDADGRFVFDRIPRGQYEVSRFIDPHPGREGETGSSHGTTVQVQSGERTKIDLGAEGRPVVARLQTSKPVADIDWSQVLPRFERKSEQPAPTRESFPNEAAFQRASALFYSSIPKHYGTVSADGRFRAEDVPPGEYNLHLILFSAPSQPETVPAESWPNQQILGILNRTVTIPGNPGERSDLAFDLGTLVIPMR